jgi:hypothetical protein
MVEGRWSTRWSTLDHRQLIFLGLKKSDILGLKKSIPKFFQEKNVSDPFYRKNINFFFGKKVSDFFVEKSFDFK